MADLLRPRLALLLVVTVFASCGGDGGGDGAPVDAAPDAFSPQGAADYCETIADFFCEFYVRCGRMDVDSAAACREPFLASCNGVFEPRYVALEAAGLLELDLDGVDACRAHLETVACDQQIQELDGPCAGMWRGQQGEGESCAPDVEFFVCTPDTECVLSLDFCGDCRPLVAVGDPCTPGENTCGSHAFCDDGECRARVANGDPCTPDDRCMTGSTCEGGECVPPSFVERGDECDRSRRCPYLTECIDGTCQPTLPIGASCSTDAECENGFCAGASGQMTCRELLDAGAACDRFNQCRSGICDVNCQPRPSACIQ